MRDTYCSGVSDAWSEYIGSRLQQVTITFAEPSTYTLIERFTPIAPNKVLWAVTIDDKATWVAPWTFEMNLTRDASQPLFEYGCHEGNYGLRNILSAARAEEKASQKK